MLGTIPLARIICSSNSERANAISSTEYLLTVSIPNDVKILRQHRVHDGGDDVHDRDGHDRNSSFLPHHDLLHRGDDGNNISLHHHGDAHDGRVHESHSNNSPLLYCVRDHGWL